MVGYSPSAAVMMAAPRSAQRDEGRIAEGFMPRFDRMAQRDAVHRFRQQGEEGRDVVGIERFVGGNCQLIGPSLSPSAVMPLAQNFSTEGHLGKDAAIGDEARSLSAEHKAVRRLLRANGRSSPASGRRNRSR